MVLQSDTLSGRWWGLLVAAWVVAGAGGCAHTTAIGRGGPVFAVSVDSIDGYRVVTAGHIAGYSFTVQVADQVVRVWPVLPDPRAAGSDPLAPPESGPTTLLEADAEALKSGILIERSWNQAVVHEVTDEELAVGAAVFFVPGERRSVVAELRFRQLRGPTVIRGGVARTRPGAGDARYIRTASRTGRTPPP